MASASDGRDAARSEEEIAWGFAPQGAPLIVEDLESEPGIELGIVHPSALELSVLVVLDQAVIGVARKGERIEPQGVDCGEVQEPKAGILGGEVWEVEDDQVVSKDDFGTLGEFVETRQCPCQVTGAEDQRTFGIRSHRSKRADAVVVPADFEVQRDARRTMVPASCHW